MRIITGILFSMITIPVTLSCSAVEYDMNGAWTSIEAYYYWKEDKEQEDISAKSATIGGTRYLVLTNSIYIVTKGKDKYLQAPGVRGWPIETIRKKDRFSYILELRAREDKEAKGNILVHFIEKDIIYFSIGGMDDAFKHEFYQCFLLLNKENLHKRCDIDP